MSLTGVPIERQKIMGVKGGVLKDDADMSKLGMKVVSSVRMRSRVCVHRCVHWFGACVHGQYLRAGGPEPDADGHGGRGDCRAGREDAVPGGSPRRAAAGCTWRSAFGIEEPGQHMLHELVPPVLAGVCSTRSVLCPFMVWIGGVWRSVPELKQMLITSGSTSSVPLAKSASDTLRLLEGNMGAAVEPVCR